MYLYNTLKNLGLVKDIIYEIRRYVAFQFRVNKNYSYNSSSSLICADMHDGECVITIYKIKNKVKDKVKTTINLKSKFTIKENFYSGCTFLKNGNLVLWNDMNVRIIN